MNSRLLAPVAALGLAAQPVMADEKEVTNLSDQEVMGLIESVGHTCMSVIQEKDFTNDGDGGKLLYFSSGTGDGSLECRCSCSWVPENKYCSVSGYGGTVDIEFRMGDMIVNLENSNPSIADGFARYEGASPVKKAAKQMMSDLKSAVRRRARETGTY